MHLHYMQLYALESHTFTFRCTFTFIFLFAHFFLKTIWKTNENVTSCNKDVNKNYL